MKLKKIIQCLEKWAPPIYQESYDNSGLMLGDYKSEISGCLISLDCTEKVVDEAISKNCNLIVSHHPIIFGGITSIDTSHWVGKVIQKAISNNINIYAIHTNLDNIKEGVNKKISDLLKLKDTSFLLPKYGFNKKLEVYIPEKDKHHFLEKIFEAGAGQIGNYKECSFQEKGIGTYIPLEGSKPNTGSKNSKQEIEEIKLEIYFDKSVESSVINTIKKEHPYDEPNYYVQDNNIESREVGSGMIGSRIINFDILLEELKKKFKCGTIKHTKIINSKVKKIAVCGGSGSFLITQAINKGADVLITSDFKYHDFFEANNEITLIDIGHYESEQFTKDLIFEFLNKNLINIALHLSNENTNPIKYY